MGCDKAAPESPERPNRHTWVLGLAHFHPDVLDGNAVGLNGPEAELELVRARIVDGPKDLFELVALMADELHNYNAILLTEAPETNAVLTLLHDSGCEA